VAEVRVIVPTRVWPEDETAREHALNAITLLSLADCDYTPGLLKAVRDRLERIVQLLDREALLRAAHNAEDLRQAGGL